MKSTPLCAMLFSMTVILSSPSSAQDPVLGFVNRIPVESTAERQARHARVAGRRAQEYLLLVHRGASRFAPENTLEAYNEAMNRGADGVEIDIRRTRDGVLYLFHDDTLDRMLGQAGRGRDMIYYDILAAAPEDRRPPTLPAFLQWARERAALLHLDIKESGLEEELIRLFDEADVWDHIVHINPYNSDRLRTRPGIVLYDYKGWVDEYMGWLRSRKEDLDRPGVYAGFLEKPGKMLFTKENPADGVRMLQRGVKEEDALPVPETLRAWWTPEGIADPADAEQ